MLVDNYNSNFEDDGFDISSSSSIDSSISKIKKCGVEIKDIMMIDEKVAFLPVNIRDLKSRKVFLENMGFIVEDTYITNRDY